MNILYLGCSKRSYATERYVAHALQQLGHVTTMKSIGPSLKHCVRLIDAVAPDFVLFSKRSAGYVPELLEICRHRELTTVTWIWDLYWGYRSSRPAQFNADVLLTTDGGHLKHWASHYPHHRVLRQGIHKPQAIAYPVDYRYDVGFVGTLNAGHPGRRNLVRHLHQVYGKRFRHLTNVRGLALNKELSRIRVVVGDSYPAPNYWSNRIYEMLGRGAFLLYPKTEGLDVEFEDGVHYVSFERNKLNRLVERINEYLDDDTTRERIRVNGHTHVRSNLTYEHRVAELIEGLPQTSHPVGFAPSRG